MTCSRCGGQLKRLGRNRLVSEPAAGVYYHHRRYACTSCGAIEVDEALAVQEAGVQALVVTRHDDPDPALLRRLAATSREREAGVARLISHRL